MSQGSSANAALGVRTPFKHCAQPRAATGGAIPHHGLSCRRYLYA